MAMFKALGGEPEAEKGIGAWSPHGRVHQGPGSALCWHLLARPWLRYLTPGAQSHMPGNPTLLGPSPQFPSATGKQGFWRRKRVSGVGQQGDRLLPGRGHTGEGSPTNRGERLRGGERGGARKSGVERTKLGQADGWVVQERGEMAIESRP